MLYAFDPYPQTTVFHGPFEDLEAADAWARKHMKFWVISAIPPQVRVPRGKELRMRDVRTGAYTCVVNK